MEIQLRLRPTWWRHPPKVKVFFDDNFLHQITLNDAEVLTFDVDHGDRSTSTITVELYDKLPDETQVKDGIIVKDQLLHIDDICIDKINLGFLIFDGVYRPQYFDHVILDAAKNKIDLPETLTKVDTLGFNGHWSISFDHPFHIWYLQNLP